MRSCVIVFSPIVVLKSTGVRIAKRTNLFHRVSFGLGQDSFPRTAFVGSQGPFSLAGSFNAANIVHVSCDQSPT